MNGETLAMSEYIYIHKRLSLPSAFFRIHLHLSRSLDDYLKLRLREMFDGISGDKDASGT